MSNLSNRSTVLLFSHPAARLVKTIPPFPPPRRINGAVPIDSLGAGNIAPSDVVLSDSHGPLQISVVPDPFNDSISTLVLSVGFDEQQWGAARRFVLPFRSFELGSDGQPLPRSKVASFDSTARPIYQGLGAGLTGTDGGSFWFFEDIGEEGALDRQRWETAQVGKRAIWTVWLLGAPAPVVDFARNLLLRHPAPIPALPPFLRDPSASPWKDTYIAVGLTLESETSSEGQSQHEPQQVANVEPNHGTPATAARPPRPLPPVPPRKPEILRSVSFPRRNTLTSSSSSATPRSPTAAVVEEAEVPTLNDTVASQDLRPEPLRAISRESPLEGSATPDAKLDRYDGIRAATDELNAAVGEAPILQTPVAPEPASMAEAQSDIPRRQSSVTESAASLTGTLRNGSRQLPPRAPDYRHSLIAVDNETGQIVGVLASGIHLDDEALPPLSASSSDEGNDEQELTTPLDEHGYADGIGGDLQVGKAVSESADETDLATPKPSVILRPASLYRDLDHRPPSRAASVLGDETFAPPPLPPKVAELARAGDASPSTRTSVASANFFSANEYRSGDEGPDDEDEDDEDARARRAMMANFISIDGVRNHQIESHRADLLRDVRPDGGDDDDDARSDVSGTTVGGPAVKLWRKARGKPPKKKKSEPAATARPPRAGSEASVRTSRAETAAEHLSDGEEESDGAVFEEDEAVSEQAAAHEGDSQDLRDEAEDVVADELLPASRLGHCTRSQMRTEDVRTIEDKVWREALESGDLPLDAPYTHLAVRGHVGSTFLPSFGSGAGAGGPPQEFELCAPGEKPRVKGGRRAQQANYMQGGTVLIEFLAGSSRIGASLIRGANLDSLTAAAATACGADAPASAPERSLVADPGKSGDSGLLSLVPLLPQHLLRFLGMSSKAPASAAAGGSDTDLPRSALTTAPSSLTSSIPFLSDVASLWTDATGWVGGFFGASTSAPASAAGPSAADVDASLLAGNDSDADEWEYAIPEYDPNSLASTPRPVYRRKRPVPSVANGFRVAGSQPQPSKQTEAIVKTDAMAPSSTHTSSETGFDGPRYSILHVDGFGVGRKTFLRGSPPLEAMQF